MDTGKLLRRVAIGGGIVVVLVAAVVAVVVATVDAGALVRYATAEASKATGRRIEVAGPVELSWWPRLALVASGVSIGNPPGASREHLAKAARLRGSVATWPLITRRAVELDRLEIDGLDLRLETLADGSGNWQFAGAGPGAGTAAAPPSRGDGGGTSVRLAGPVVLGGADIVWAPRGESNPESIRIERFEIAPRDGARLGWAGRLEHQKTSWSLEAASGDPFASIRERVPFDFDARLDGGGVAVKAKGRVERRDSGPGAVADVTVEWAAGSERITSLAPALAREAGKVGGRLEIAGRRITIAGLAGAIAGARFDGNLLLDASAPVERIRGRLHVERVDLAKLRAAGGAPKPTPATASARAATPATHALKRVDADVDFVVDRIATGGVEIANTRGRVVVADGKLAADPVVAELGGGTLTLRVQADAATDRARVVLDGRNIEVGRVAGALPAGRSASGGRATLAVDLQGPASDAFVARSSGSIRADIGPMRIEGPPSATGAESLSRLADAINPLRRTEKSTELQCVVARLTVRDGVAHAERTLAAETSVLAVSASGTIDLGHQTLDLLIRPRARKGLSIGAVELAELVRVTGPIANPSIGLDKVGAAKAAIAVGGAVASGGWSLLASPLLNAGEDPSPCATARAGGKATGEPAAGTAPRPAEDLAGALRGLFKR
ncbi:MAG: AsmA family protein [Burkholderiales bacterium]